MPLSLWILLQPLMSLVAPTTSESSSSCLEEPARIWLILFGRSDRLSGAKRYVEVGSRDKGNIAWLSERLATDAVIVDVDLENRPASERKLRQYIAPTQSYTMIEGNSVAPDTVAGVERALGGEKADLIFLDLSHMYDHFLQEVELYLPLVKSGGLLMFHDALWEGNESGKGQSTGRTRDRPVFACVLCGYEPAGPSNNAPRDQGRHLGYGWSHSERLKPLPRVLSR